MAALIQLGLYPASEIEVLDLRHFSGAQLAPLLRDQARHWNSRLRWDYSRSIQLLQEHIDSRVLPGYVALDEHRRVLGYTFAVYEANKAVLGDVWAFDAGSAVFGRACEMLLETVLEMLVATPGIDRIESPMLMFEPGVLGRVFAHRGFRSHPRLFMMAELGDGLPTVPTKDGYAIERWTMASFAEAAAAIHASYRGHEDATINDQYQTVAGAERFLQNIIRFPGCGLFDAEHSLLVRNSHTRKVEGVLLCSRVRQDTAHITQLCVVPGLHGQGLGAAMLAACAAQLKKSGFRAISLTVTERNLAARRLYARFGFRGMHRFEAMTWDR